MARRYYTNLPADAFAFPVAGRSMGKKDIVIKGYKSYILDINYLDFQISLNNHLQYKFLS
jgi:hypothetical protein